MTWFKVDDGFAFHPKVLGLSDAALATWLRAGCYAARYDTGGHISDDTARHLRLNKRGIEQLLAAGLWTRNGKGWDFHDWDVYQPNPEEAQARMRTGGGIGAHRRWHAARGIIQPGCPWCAPA